MRVLICGLGSIGFRHYKNFYQLGVREFGFVTSGKSTLPEAEKIKQNYTCYPDIESAFRETFDVCVVSNPSSMHVAYTEKALQQGVHLFLEKPISAHNDSLTKIKALLNCYEKVAAVTFQFRYHPQINQIKNLLNKKEIFGKPLTFRSEWSEYLPDWHPWEDYRFSYAANRDLGGGVYFTQVHPYNYLCFLLGDLNIQQVALYNNGYLGIDVEEIADINLNNDLCSGSIHIDYLKRPRSHTLEIITSTGVMFWDCHASLLTFYDVTGELIYDQKLENFDRNEMFLSMTKHFLECISNGGEPNTTLASAVAEAEALKDGFDKAVSNSVRNL